MKKIVSIFMILCVLFSLASCSHNKALQEASSGAKVPKYTNLNITKNEYIVSDDFLNYMMNETTKRYATVEEVKEGVVQDGDVVNITYTTYKDEQLLQDAALSDFTFTIGQGVFVKKFEEALIGKAIGESFELELSYPFNSTYTILDGKTVVHHIVINHVCKTIYPELTDEFIQTHVKESVVKEEAACSTVSEYREYLRERYEFVYEKISQEAVVSDVLKQLLETAEFPEISDEELDQYATNKYDYYVKYCEENGSTIDAYLANEELTREEFCQQLRKDGEELIKKTMLVNAIKEFEELELTDAYYNSYLEYLTIYYQFDSVEQLKSSISTLGVEETVKNDAMHEVVYDFIVNHQNITIKQIDLMDLVKEGEIE